MSIDNMKPCPLPIKKSKTATTQQNTPIHAKRLADCGGSFLSRATADYQNKKGDKNRFSDLQRSNTNRDNKTPGPEGCFIPYAGVPVARHTTKLAPKKPMVSKQNTNTETQSIHNFKSPCRLQGSRSSEFHPSANKKNEKVKASSSSDLSKHIKSLSTVIYGSASKKKPLACDKQNASIKNLDTKMSKSSRSLNGNNVYCPAYHMKLNMV